MRHENNKHVEDVVEYIATPQANNYGLLVVLTEMAGRRTLTYQAHTGAAQWYRLQDLAIEMVVQSHMREL